MYTNIARKDVCLSIDDESSCIRISSRSRNVIQPPFEGSRGKEMIPPFASTRNDDVFPRVLNFVVKRAQNQDDHTGISVTG